jgi:hypothetical protein
MPAPARPRAAPPHARGARRRNLMDGRISFVILLLRIRPEPTRHGPSAVEPERALGVDEPVNPDVCAKKPPLLHTGQMSQPSSVPAHSVLHTKAAHC